MNKPLVALAGIILLSVGTLSVAPPDWDEDALQETPSRARQQSSNIRLTFTRGGVPATIRLAREISVLSADGMPCSAPSVLGPIDSSGYTTPWPLSHGPKQPEPCSDPPPTRLRFEFTPEDSGPNDEKDFKAEFLWTGEDITALIEIPSLITLRFVSDSQARPIRLTSPFIRLFADGQDCRPPLFRGDYTVSQYSTAWPFAGPPGYLQTPCTNGRSVSLRFEFDSDVGAVVSEFAWNGGDAAIDVEVPAMPNGLPETGGRP